ncbi:MAG: flagellar biosynthetic protein FliO [Alicyclobacillus sp.]|nr:flagellar biosynthetic protein FliO [Alicyclobacillus sp.]
MAKAGVRGWQTVAAGCFVWMRSGDAFAATSPTVSDIAGNPVWTALKLLGSLAVLICFIVLFIRFLAKRAHIGGRAGDLKVVAARQIGPGKTVQVIEWHTQRFLIGVGEQVTLLADLPTAAEDKAASVAPEVDFADLLAQRLRQLRGARGESEAGRW